MKTMILTMLSVSFFMMFSAVLPVNSAAAERESAQPGKNMRGVVNINTATPSQIAELPGVGPSLAARIVERRMQKPFASAADLKTVKGVGEKKFKELSRFIAVSGATTFRSESPNKKEIKKNQKREKTGSSKSGKKTQALILPDLGASRLALI